MEAKDYDIDNVPLMFGKHKGYTPAQISTSDPEYLIWATETLDRQICSIDLFEECMHSVYENNNDDATRKWNYYGD
jgi:hypothetical protein